MKNGLVKHELKSAEQNCNKLAKFRPSRENYLKIILITVKLI